MAGYVLAEQKHTLVRIQLNISSNHKKLIGKKGENTQIILLNVRNGICKMKSDYRNLK